MKLQQSANFENMTVSRRKLISNLTKASGVLLLSSLISKAAAFMPFKKGYTVGEIIDLFIKQVPGGVLKDTVDTLKSGNRDIKVTGIVTTAFATVEVIKKAIGLGANFIIAHEPTFYNHFDDTNWLQNDEVYKYKADLLKKHNIAVWRNHDYIHTTVPDGVIKATLDQLQWQKYADNNIINLPTTTLQQLINHLKSKLDIKQLRYIGNLNQNCSKILFMPGAPGGQRQIEAISKVKPDVIVCGEIQEWETPEYVRDAQAKGNKTALIVLGHIASEDEGSEFMLNWLKANVSEISVTRIKPGDSLSFG